MKPPAYLRFYLIGLILIIGLMGGLNFVIDPYDINGLFHLQRVNLIKPEVVSHIRLSKAYQITRTPPDAIILGSSRARAIDITHPGWASSTTHRLNLALDGVNMAEVLQYFKHAVQGGKLKQAVIGLDFFYFNAFWASGDQSGNAVFVEQNDPFKQAAVNLQLPVLLSLDTLSSSLATLRFNRRTPLPTHAQITWQGIASGDNLDIHKQFVRSETQFIQELFFPPPLKIFRFDDHMGHSSLQEFRELVHLAKAKGIDLTLYISPSHARQWELIRATGLWPQFEAWKRQLVQILDEEHAPQRKYPLWDFSGYNSITTEALPWPTNHRHTMENYSDSSHFSHKVGQLVLNRVFSSDRRIFDCPADFGTLLNKNNIESHLAWIRQQQTQYRATHREDAAEIERLVADLKGK